MKNTSRAPRILRGAYGPRPQSWNLVPLLSASYAKSYSPFRPAITDQMPNVRFTEQIMTYIGQSTIVHLVTSMNPIESLI